MQYIVLALLIIVIIFGISSGLQSQAQIETARAAQAAANAGQVSAWGNLITIVVVALIVLVGLGLIVVYGWWRLKTWNQRAAATNAKVPSVTASSQPQFTLNDLVQLEMLRTLRSWNAPPSGSTPMLIEEKEEQDPPVSEDPLQWLR